MKNILRICKGCKVKKNRNEMAKITLSGGEIFINPNSKICGRSLYVCYDRACLKNLIKSKAIKRSLKFNNDFKIKEIENNLDVLINSKMPESHH